MTEQEADDLAVTTAHLYHYSVTDQAFFLQIDNVLKIAKLFIKKYPTGTDWEKTPQPWSDTLHEFYLEQTKKPIT